MKKIHSGDEIDKGVMAIYQEIKKKISRSNSPTLNDKIKKI
jgi:hypothetical protein